jgi:hypothetical protein
MKTFEDYLERFAYLITKTDDENAAWMIMSIEVDPVSTLAFISDLMYGKFEDTADKLYTLYTVSGVSYESVKIAVSFMKDEYSARNLPTDVSNDTMLYRDQVITYLKENNEGTGGYIL